MVSGKADIDDLLARLEDLEAREQIRDVLYRYARGVDRGDIDLLKSCYHPDATDCHWFFNGKAHAFADFVIPLLRKIPNSQHSITNPIIDLDGEKAFVECQFYVVHRVHVDETKIVDQQVEGRYLDVFERRNGDWKISYRRLLVEAFREHVVDAEQGNRYPADHPAVAKRQPDDPLYRGYAIAQEPFEPVEGSDLWAAVRERHR